MISRINITIILLFMTLLVPAAVYAAIIDTDGDFMPDSWEITYGLNPYDPSDAFGDKDNDGYTNLEEYGANTEPGNNSFHPGILSAAGLTARGKQLLENQELVAANHAFELAVEADPVHQDANFFHALTRLTSLIMSNEEGNDPNTIETVKELLDSLGVTPSGRSLYGWTADYQRDLNGDIVLPNTTPTGDEIQGFVQDHVILEISGALTNLTRVNAGFQTLFTPLMFNEYDGNNFGISGDTEVDYTDVVFFRALLQAVKGSLYLATAYDSDEFDIIDFTERIRTTAFNVNEIFNLYPDILTIKRLDNFALAKASLTKAISSYFDGSELLRGETDNQLNDLISIDPGSLSAEADFRITLEDFELAMSGPTNIRPDEPDARDHTGDYLTLDLTRLFDTPFHLRDYRPQFTANVPCSMPDATFNNMFPNLSHSDWEMIWFRGFDRATVFSGHWSDGYYAEIFAKDRYGLIDAVSVTGPGINGTMDLVYRSGDGSSPPMWWHTSPPFLGSNVPSEPQTYSINVTDSYGSCSYDSTITGYVEEFATYLYPIGGTSGQITFFWKGVPDSDGYSLEMSDNYGNRLWNAYDLGPWRNNISYGYLTSGETYSYSVRTEIETDGVSNYSFAEASFQYTGYDQPVPGSISGRVLNAQTGLPMSSVNIQPHIYQYSYNDWGGSTWTNSDGYYTINGLTPGYYRVQSRRKQIYASKYYNNVFDFNSAEAVLVSAGVNRDGINFSMSQGGYIEGSVTAEDTGLPINGVTVHAYGFSDYNIDYATVSTNSDGYYIMTGLQPGDYRVMVFGYGDYRQEYYNNSYDWYYATPVHVDAGIFTDGIDFSMSQGYACHSYDTDTDWCIGDFELLDAIDAWVADQLGDFALLDLIDLWAGGCYCYDAEAKRYSAGEHNEFGGCPIY